MMRCFWKARSLMVLHHWIKGGSATHVEKILQGLESGKAASYPPLHWDLTFVPEFRDVLLGGGA